MQVLLVFLYYFTCYVCYVNTHEPHIFYSRSMHFLFMIIFTFCFCQLCINWESRTRIRKILSKVREITYRTVFLPKVSIRCSKFPLIIHCKYSIYICCVTHKTYVFQKRGTVQKSPDWYCKHLINLYDLAKHIYVIKNKLKCLSYIL